MPLQFHRKRRTFKTFLDAGVPLIWRLLNAQRRLEFFRNSTTLDCRSSPFHFKHAYR